MARMAVLARERNSRLNTGSLPCKQEGFPLNRTEKP